MSYQLEFSNLALKQLEAWKQSGQKKTISKIISLLEELTVHPRTGTGQVEQLRNDLSGYWSSRIDKANRLIYKIEEEKVVVAIISMKGHYN